MLHRKCPKGINSPPPRRKCLICNLKCQIVEYSKLQTEKHGQCLYVLSAQKILTSSGRATRWWPMYFPIRRSLPERPEPDNTFWTEGTSHHFEYRWRYKQRREDDSLVVAFSLSKPKRFSHLKYSWRIRTGCRENREAKVKARFAIGLLSRQCDVAIEVAFDFLAFVRHKVRSYQGGLEKGSGGRPARRATGRRRGHALQMKPSRALHVVPACQTALTIFYHFLQSKPTLAEHSALFDKLIKSSTMRSC